MNESEKDNTVKEIMPGFDTKDINVHLNERILTIKGEKNRKRSEK